MRGNAYTRAIDERTTSLECSCFASVVHCLQADGMTEEECNIKESFTRCKLMHLSNSDQWIECFNKQLNDHHAVPLFGKPVLRWSLAGTNGKPLNILRLHWSNIVKLSGVQKCQCCMDALKRSAPWLRMFLQTYASCVEQPCMQLFFALCAVLSFLVFFANT